MAAPAFVTRLNEQIGHEFSAHQQYVAIATYYESLTMPQMAALFYQQALEERDHAMMMVRYLLDADEAPVIPALDAPTIGFSDVVEPVAAALAQEKRVTEQVNGLTRIARENNDFASDQFMQWFIKEQVEELSKMSDLLAVVTRSKDDYERIEDWVVRLDPGEDSDPTAPPIPVRRVVAFLAVASVAALGGACGKNAEPASGATVALTISVVSQEGVEPKTFDLTCDPDGGSHPQPKQACAALMKAGPEVFKPTAANQQCTQIYGGPQTATVKGSYEGTEVDAAFSRENGCEIDRWEKLGTTFFDLPLQ